jgi:hypothetical protein
MPVATGSTNPIRPTLKSSKAVAQIEWFPGTLCLQISWQMKAHGSTLPSSQLAHLATIPDPRGARGRRHEWDHLLTLIVAAMMAGENNPTGVSRWVCDWQQGLVQVLQPAHRCVPHLSMLQRVLCHVSIVALERAIDAYLRGLSGEMDESGQIETLTGERLTGQAVDCKTARCATSHSAGDCHEL